MGLKKTVIATGFLSLLMLCAALTPGSATAEIAGSASDLLNPPDFQAPKVSGEISDSVPDTKVGKIVDISPSQALGEQQVRSLSAAASCHRQNVVVNYPELRFTGIKKWCYYGRRVTTGTMDVQTYIKPEHKYTQNRDGWVYVPRALKNTDRFVTVNGITNARHISTRTGRFEYRVHGQTKPQVVYIPHVVRIGYGTGACNGPAPRDLAPKITAIAPTSGKTGVQRGTNIVAMLNMEAKEGTSNIGTFYAINRKTGEFVEGATGRYTKNNKAILIVPDKPLAPNTTYSVTVSAGPYGVLGKTGDPLVAGRSWSFTTSGP